MSKQRNAQPDSSIIAELTILHELSAFVMAETKQQLIWEVIEKVTRFFGATYFAVVSGVGQSQELVVSFGLDTLEEVLERIKDIENHDNRMVVACNENTAEQNLLFFEQALPIDDRTRRLYGILAGRFDNSLTSFRLKEKKAQIEAALIESQRMLRVVLDTIPVRVFWKDKNLKYLGCNKLFAQDAGFSTPFEVIGKDDFQMVWKDQALLYRSDDQKVLETGVEKLNYEEPQVTSDSVVKTIKTIKTSKIPLKDSDNNILGVLGAYEDITEAKAAEREKEKLQLQLVDSQKLEAIGRLAGGVAHDFNNKLGVIIGYAEMAIGDLAQDNPLRADLEEILKAAKSSAELTKQLLAFARQQDMVPREINLNEVISGMVEMLYRLIGEDIELAWVPGSDIWTVKIDPVQVNRILTNLCKNAGDAVEHSGKVTIETANVLLSDRDCADSPNLIPGEFVLLSVSDNGRGMDKETVENIFEPFFTTKDVGQGTGLGLATVYGVVKQNHGFIHVTSEPGVGSIFRIYLPRYKETPDQTPSSI